ncbi:hypothetical protein EJ02DRAFT_436749 [Clathrospora elynae]|uniref:EF-hand domain-containing protein n=1 Tax=Clathrospora elynae TaxID=706981 RepID=A0A6A5SGE4_9PLEO|nr:hypothetical protein EJ02DRAFT_436749 [Clathrospora elynae]
MGAFISLPFTLLNALLPFTRPGTPLAQDLVHTAILCGTLYFAPQMAEWYNAQQAQDGAGRPEQAEHTHQPSTEGVELDRRREEEDPPLDERLVLADDGEGDLQGPPPLAPTPPPPHHVQNHHPHHQAQLEGFPEPVQHQPAFPNHEAEAGPANPRPATPTRTIGVKKAKSIAQKNQQRMRNDFYRSEAEMRRLVEAEGAEEREAALAASRQRRSLAEEAIRERTREEREKRKEEERLEAEEEVERRERVVAAAREEMLRGGGAVDLVDIAWTEGKDRVWAERLVRASGLLGQLQDGAHVIITGQGWLVKIDEEVMQRAYAHAETFGSGKVSFAEFGGLLEKAVLARAKA